MYINSNFSLDFGYSIMFMTCCGDQDDVKITH